MAMEVPKIRVDSEGSKMEISAHALIHSLGATEKPESLGDWVRDAVVRSLIHETEMTGKYGYW